MSSISTLRQYGLLTQEISTLEEKLAKAKAKREQLEEPVLAYFERQGIQNITVGKIQLYMRREVWIGRKEDVGHETAAQALTAVGLGEYAAARVNIQGLSALYREMAEDEDAKSFFDAYPSLEPILKATEKFKVGHRKS